MVEPLSGRLLREGATSTTVEEILLHDSYHVATLDNDAPTDLRGQRRVLPLARAGARHDAARPSRTGATTG